MKSIALIDTSIFCEVLDVPSKASDAGKIRKELERKVAADEVLLLPMTAVIETGNHIGQCSSDGGLRRKVAMRFVGAVLKAMKGKAPFTPTPFFESVALEKWLAEFPEWAVRTDPKGKGSGLGDLTIQKEWDRQRELNPGRRVYIWSKDQHLSSYDTDNPPAI